MINRFIRALALCAFVAASARTSLAQIPDTFENLQVFPKDIPHDSLVQAMRRITGSLGVRCTYCHAGGNGQSLQGVDFASDDKPAKKKARFMLRMTDSLNRVTLAALTDRSNPPVQIECITCHRGSPVPRTLAATLVELDEKLGVDSAIARYRSLRETAMESGRYDFSEESLTEAAGTLAQRQKVADAVRILELNAEVHAGSPRADMALGDMYARNGDKDKAIARYRAVLARQPNNPQVKRRLQQLGVSP